MGKKKYKKGPLFSFSASLEENLGGREHGSLYAQEGNNLLHEERNMGEKKFTASLSAKGRGRAFFPILKKERGREEEEKWPYCGESSFEMKKSP